MPSAKHISNFSSAPVVLSFNDDVDRRATRIAKVYENESYDYPTQIQESLTEFGSSLSHNITTFAATNLKVKPDEGANSQCPCLNRLILGNFLANTDPLRRSPKCS